MHCPPTQTPSGQSPSTAHGTVLTLMPEHDPPPSQLSPYVQDLASSHTVPGGAATWRTVPVDGSHRSSVHESPSRMAVIAPLAGLQHCPATNTRAFTQKPRSMSQESVVQASPSLQSATEAHATSHSPGRPYHWRQADALLKVVRRPRHCRCNRVGCGTSQTLGLYWAATGPDGPDVTATDSPVSIGPFRASAGMGRSDSVSCCNSPGS